MEANHQEPPPLNPEPHGFRRSARRRWLGTLLVLVEVLPALLLTWVYLTNRERILRGRPWLFAGAVAQGRIESARFSSDGDLELINGYRPIVLTKGGELVPAGHPVNVTRHRWSSSHYRFEASTPLAEWRWQHAFARDGNTVADSDYSALIKLRDARDWRLQRTFTASGQVTALALAPDGSRVAAGNDHRAEIWDGQSGELIFTLHTGPVRALKFSPDGRTLGILRGNDYDGKLTLYDATTGAELRTLLSPDDRAIHDFDLAPDDRTVAFSCATGLVCLSEWRRPGSRPHALQAGNNPVRAVAFSPDGRKLAGAQNGAARVWNIPGGALRRTLPSRAAGDVPPGISSTAGQVDSDAVTAVTFAPDNETLAAQTESGGVLLWNTR